MTKVLAKEPTPDCKGGEAVAVVGALSVVEGSNPRQWRGFGAPASRNEVSSDPGKRGIP